MPETRPPLFGFGFLVVVQAVLGGSIEGCTVRFSVAIHATFPHADGCAAPLKRFEIERSPV